MKNIVDIDEALAPIKQQHCREFNGETDGGMVWNLSVSRNQPVSDLPWLVTWDCGYYCADGGRYCLTNCGSQAFSTAAQLKSLLDHLDIPWKTLKYAVK